MVLITGIALVACTNGSGNQVIGPIALGMTSQMAATYDDGLTQMYEVQLPVPFPVRAPVGAEANAPPIAGTPYPNAPFLTADQEQVEVHYTLSNVDDKAHDVWLLIYPWNEFVRWKPIITVVGEETALPGYGYDQYFTIPGKSRLQGTITSDDMHEIAIKLAAVENLLSQAQAQMQMNPGVMMTYGQQDPTTLANHIMNPQNRSNSGDPLFTPWIPSVIAGVTGFDLGLRTQSGAEDYGGTASANIAVEITVSIVDVQGNRFIPQGTSGDALGEPPATLSP
jgi:hypothetical protein